MRTLNKPTLGYAALLLVTAATASMAEVTDVYLTDRADGSAGTGSIVRFTPDGLGGMTTVVTGLSDPRGLYFDNANDQIVWSEIDDGEIRRADPDGSNEALIIGGLGNVLGVTVDPAGNQLFWAEFNPDGIFRANIDGTGSTQILSSGDIGGDGVDVAINPASGRLYSSVSDDKIFVSEIDGSNAVQVVTTPGGAPAVRGIAIDELAAKIYWVDRDQGVIERSNLDGTGIESVLTGLGDLRRVALDPVGGKLYWADRTSDTAHRADLFDGANAETIASGLSDVWGIGLRIDAVNAEASLPPLAPSHALVIDHRVDNNPTFERAPWAEYEGPGDATGGPGSEVIGGQTYRYWSTDDNSTSSGGFVNYSTSLTPEQLLGPWRASARVRLVEGTAAATLFHVDDGLNRWAIWLKEGSVQTRNFAGTFYDIAVMDTTLEYNLYEMVYTPLVDGEINDGDLVTFLINGVVVDTILRSYTRDRAAPDFPSMFRWGSGSSGGVGEANWNYVAFSTIVPEPSTAVATAGVLGLAGLRRRRRSRD